MSLDRGLSVAFTLCLVLGGAGVLASACSESEPSGGAGGASSSTTTTTTSGAGGGGAASSTSDATTGSGGSGGSVGSGGSGGSGAGGDTGAGGAAAGGGGQGGSGGSGCVDPIQLPLFTTPPALLSETGLYADIATSTVAEYVRSFDVSYVLWSDGSEKHRWAYIPPCTQIDTTDMDHWVFPVGTWFWKEFDKDGIRIETRIIHRFGPGPDDWIFGAYLWNDAQTDADSVPNGVHNAKGTPHDVPSKNDCISCHTGLDERINGFSAFQLSHGGPGATMASLSAEGLLTVPAPDGFTPPGNDVDRAALGYMHANCGHCHFFGSAIPPVFNLRLSVNDATVADTGAFVTAVGVGLVGFSAPGVTKRIVAGDPDASAVVYRMEQRGVLAQMPPLGTEYVHPEGVQAVVDWITALP